MGMNGHLRGMEAPAQRSWSYILSYIAGRRYEVVPKTIRRRHRFESTPQTSYYHHYTNGDMQKLLRFSSGQQSNVYDYCAIYLDYNTHSILWHNISFSVDNINAPLIYNTINNSYFGDRRTELHSCIERYRAYRLIRIQKLDLR